MSAARGSGIIFRKNTFKGIFFGPRRRAVLSFGLFALLTMYQSPVPGMAAENSPNSPNSSGITAPVQSPATTSASGLKPVLDPNKYFGHAKSGYAAAKLCPEICAQLFCYCGCDLTDEHSSLLDCFTTDHGVDCHICQEEALIALKMKREGKTMKQIQQAIDVIFEKEYPFDEPSETIKKYRANRLWQPSKTVAPIKATAGAATAGKVKKKVFKSTCCGNAKKKHR